MDRLAVTVRADDIRSEGVCFNKLYLGAKDHRGSRRPRHTAAAADCLPIAYSCTGDADLYPATFGVAGSASAAEYHCSVNTESTGRPPGYTLL